MVFLFDVYKGTLSKSSLDVVFVCVCFWHVYKMCLELFTGETRCYKFPLVRYLFMTHGIVHPCER